MTWSSGAVGPGNPRLRRPYIRLMVSAAEHWLFPSHGHLYLLSVHKTVLYWWVVQHIYRVGVEVQAISLYRAAGRRDLLLGADRSPPSPLHSKVIASVGEAWIYIAPQGD